MDIIKKSFGEQLRTCRKIKNFTQEKLAEKIGINLRQLARIESGESFVTTETLFNICSVLEISPKILFDFEIYQETLMTGTGTNTNFKVIKNGNLIQLINKEKEIEDEQKDFDNRMLKVAKNLNKDITVDELIDGTLCTTKIYKSNGEIEIIDRTPEKEEYKILIDNINKIKNDKSKIEYMNLAYSSLKDKESLDKLKSMIKGIELTMDNPTNQ